MISLKQPKEPYELALPYGITVTVAPLITAGMAAAQAAARRALESIETQIRERKDAGLPRDGLPDLGDEVERDGLYHALLIKELAVRHIVAWSGVLADDGETEAQLSRENVLALMDLYPVGERFFQEITLRQVLLNAAKNAFRPSAAGTSSRAEGRNTATGAEVRDSTVPAAVPEAMEAAVSTANTLS